MKELGFAQDTVTLFTDNSANIDLSINERISARTAHIDTRFHFVKDKVRSREFELKFLGTEFIPADALTKALPLQSHKRHSEALHNQPLVTKCQTQE